MLCPACGSKMKDDERSCKACGTLIMHGPKVRNETSFNTPSFNTMEDGVKKALEEEVAAKKAAEETIARKAAEKAAAKKAEEEAAAKRAAEEAAKKEAARKAAVKKAEEEAAAKRAAEEAARKAAAKKAEEEAAAKRAAEEAARKAAAKKAEEEAAAKKAAEEAARKAAVKKAEEEAAAKRAAEEAARKAAAKKAEEEAAAKQAAEEKAAVEAAIESVIKSAQETAAKKAADEAAAKKAAEEAAAKKAAEEAAAKSAEKGSVSQPQRLSYKIIGGNIPSASVTLDEGQTIFTQSDAMIWMSFGIAMETGAKRGGSAFTASYTSREYGQEIGIAGRFPGEILVLNISGRDIVVRKEAFLAAQPSVSLLAHVSMNLGDENDASVTFQRLSGAGMAFIAIGGSLIERVLSAEETIKADTANIAAFEDSVSFQTRVIGDFKNTVFGEGLFLSTLTGPGKVWLQSLTVHK